MRIRWAWCAGLVAALIVAGPAGVATGRDDLQEAARVGAIASADGRELFRETFGAREGAAAIMVAASARTILIELRRCFSDDRRYRRGDRTVVALDAASGNERWRENDASVRPVRDYETTFGAGWAGYPPGPIPIQDVKRQPLLRVVDPDTGRELWRTWPSRVELIAADRASFITTEAVAFDESLAPPMEPVEIRAVSRRDGRVRWTSDLPPAMRPFSAASDGDLAVVSALSPLGPGQSVATEKLVVFDSRTGSRVSEIDLLPGTFPFDLQVQNGVVVFTAGGTVEAFDARSAAHLWTHTEARATRDLAHRHRVIVRGRDGAIDALDVRTGGTVWSVAGENLGVSRAGSVVLIADGKRVSARRLDDGVELWSRRLKSTGFVAGATEYFVTADGCLTTTAD